MAADVSSAGMLFTEIHIAHPRHSESVQATGSRSYSLSEDSLPGETQCGQTGLRRRRSRAKSSSTVGAHVRVGTCRGTVVPSPPDLRSISGSQGHDGLAVSPNSQHVSISANTQENAQRTSQNPVPNIQSSSTLQASCNTPSAQPSSHFSRSRANTTGSGLSTASYLLDSSPAPSAQAPQCNHHLFSHELWLQLRDNNRRRHKRCQSDLQKRLPACGPNVALQLTSLEDYPEHICSICLDVLSHPVSLRACSHLFCRLCIFEMIQTSLETGQYAPCCPLCRTEIERMSDIVKEKVLAESIYNLFPEQVMHKVSTTHSLEKQKALAAKIKKLAEMIFEAVEAHRRLSDRRIESAGALVEVRPERTERRRRLFGRFRLRGSDLESEDESGPLLLTVEVICLTYSVLLFLFLCCLRFSRTYG